MELLTFSIPALLGGAVTYRMFKHSCIEWSLTLASSVAGISLLIGIYGEKLMLLGYGFGILLVASYMMHFKKYRMGL